MKNLLLILYAFVALASCSPEQKAFDRMHWSYRSQALYPGTASFADEYVEYSTDSLFIINVTIRELGDSGYYQRREMQYCYGIFEDERREIWRDLSETLGFLDFADLLLVNDGLEFPYTKEDAVEVQVLIDGVAIYETTLQAIGGSVTLYEFRTLVHDYMFSHHKAIVLLGMSVSTTSRFPLKASRRVFALRRALTTARYSRQHCRWASVSSTSSLSTKRRHWCFSFSTFSTAENMLAYSAP